MHHERHIYLEIVSFESLFHELCHLSHLLRTEACELSFTSSLDFDSWRARTRFKSDYPVLFNHFETCPACSLSSIWFVDSEIYSLSSMQNV